MSRFSGGSRGFHCFPPPSVSSSCLPLLLLPMCLCPWVWLLQRRDAPAWHQHVSSWNQPSVFTAPVPDCSITFGDYTSALLLSFLGVFFAVRVFLVLLSSYVLLLQFVCLMLVSLRSACSSTCSPVCFTSSHLDHSTACPILSLEHPSFCCK